ncbi:MAG: hypothetical protein JW702_08950 [Clostridiales bacterium]|nr:hypothetical protein [Clostridiales bacterium]
MVRENSENNKMNECYWNPELMCRYKVTGANYFADDAKARCLVCLMIRLQDQYKGIMHELVQENPTLPFNISFIINRKDEIASKAINAFTEFIIKNYPKLAKRLTDELTEKQIENNEHLTPKLWTYC